MRSRIGVGKLLLRIGSQGDHDVPTRIAVKSPDAWKAAMSFTVVAITIRTRSLAAPARRSVQFAPPSVDCHTPWVEARNMRCEVESVGSKSIREISSRWNVAVASSVQLSPPFEEYRMPLP
jgi:hypothetical protein